MQQPNVLIVEDDTSLSSTICDTLESAGYRVTPAKNGIDALQKLEQHPFGMVISDVQMNQMDGLTLLNRIKAEQPDLPVLLITAYGTIERAIEAIQAGAVGYLVKPFEADTLVRQVGQNLLQSNPPTDGCIIQDRGMTKLFGLATRVAKTDVTVLIQGESGTGKEILARHIYQSSTRNSGPYIAVNCAAIPENMLEAMLFGYEKGAFTGAYQATPGKFELAQKGTLLLDEISEMDLALQAKLLRVLQEKEVERLGGTKVIRLDVRVLATTNLNLKEQVANGKFREDLFYRINVFPLRVPPLRQRCSDIIPLAEEFIRKYGQHGRKLPNFEPKAAELLQKYTWPGNVRELENIVQRALIIQNGDTISVDDIIFEELSDFSVMPVGEQPELPGNILDKNLRCMEEQIILQTLVEEKGSRKSTAERLGVSPRTLRYKIARMREAGAVLPC